MSIASRKPWLLFGFLEILLLLPIQPLGLTTTDCSIFRVLVQEHPNTQPKAALALCISRIPDLPFFPVLSLFPETSFMSRETSSLPSCPKLAHGL